MTATLCLIGCLLSPAQPSPGAAWRGEWAVAPRLSKAQELVYRGTFTEEAAGGSVQFSRAFRVESRVFVLETPPQGADVAFLTVLKKREAQPGAPAIAGPPTGESVRLELAHVDLQGAVRADAGASLSVPLEGPPTVECGAFAAVPDGKVTPDSAWETGEDGRPTHALALVGPDMVVGARCLKLEGVQKSDDWDKPRADRTAWRRIDTVWPAAPRLGVASRVQRVIERREPGHDDATYKSVLRYDLEEPMQYPGRLYEERQREIMQAHAFAEAAAPLLDAPAKYGPQLSALLNRIAYHLDHQPQTPYREAVFQVKRRIEAAQRGETPPVVVADDRPEAVVASVGAPAPDFLAPDLATSGTFSLRQTRGRPVLLVFYNPASPTAAELLGYAQRMSASKDLTVLALSMSGDLDAARKQRADLKLTLPVLDGSGLRISYDVDGTPKLMLLDAAGILRGEYAGWGTETPDEVTADLRRWAKK